mmetsp:Transcript_109621/g.266483  ORF Transcript_109621/g.266483 Transcript_109621/m.266483 type:complete len:264 (-) Transcript_109621:244-1035(-)
MSMDSYSTGRSGVALAMAGLAAADAFVLPSGSGGVQGPSLLRSGSAAAQGSDQVNGEAGGPRRSLASSGVPLAAVAALGAGVAALGTRSLAAHAGGRQRARRSATARPAFDPAAEVGAMAPLGYFDPLGFAKADDPAGFRILRMAELKHGRVAMMASIGLVAQHFLKLPGAESVPAGIGALSTVAGQVGFVAIFAWSGVLEGVWKEEPGKEPGNFGDPFGLGMYDAEMRNREINNGRFAMIAVTGILAAELATGKDAIQQFGL